MSTYTRYTTAAPAYDGFSTVRYPRPVGYLKRTAVYQIEVDLCDLDCQTARNSSGLHPTWTPEQWRDLLDAGLASDRDPDDVCPECGGETRCYCEDDTAGR